MTNQPAPALPRLRKAVAGFVILTGFLAVFLLVVFVADRIVAMFQHGASKIADGIYLPATIPHEALWAIFSVYVAVLVLIVTRAARGRSWVAEMCLYVWAAAAGIGFVVLLLQSEFVHFDPKTFTVPFLHTTITYGFSAPHYVLGCGSFLDPAPHADQQVCDPEYKYISRSAIEVAAWGMGVPFAVSGITEYRTTKKRQPGE